MTCLEDAAGGASADSDQLVEFERAAAQIQRWWRKYHYLVRRKTITPEEDEIVKFRLEKAAARIQRWWRKCHAFLRVSPEGGATEMRVQRAAARIQRWWRKYHALIDGQEENILKTEEENCSKTAGVAPQIPTITDTIPETLTATVATNDAAARCIQRWWRKTSRDKSRQNTLISSKENPQLNSINKNTVIESDCRVQNGASFNGALELDGAAQRIQRWWRKFGGSRENNQSAIISLNEKEFALELPQDTVAEKKLCDDSLTIASPVKRMDSNAAARRIQRWWRTRGNAQRACTISL